MLMDLFASCDFYFSKMKSFKKISWFVSWLWMVLIIGGIFFWKKKKKSILVFNLKKWFNTTVKKKIFLSCFIVFLGCKFWGLIPYIFGLTTQIVCTFFLAMILWTSMIFSSIFFSFKGFLAHLIPFGSPLVLVPFLLVMEILSQFLRPMALALRLAINMTTGHVFVGLLAIGIQMCFLKMKIFYFFFLMMMLFFYFLFELGICLIQSFVFNLLLSVWMEE